MTTPIQNLIAARLRARKDAQRGFITMQVLALTVLLMVAAGGLVAVAQATIHTSRESRAFTEARRTADYAQTAIENSFQSGLVPIYVDSAGTMTQNQGNESFGGGMSYTWVSVPSKGTVEVEATRPGVAGELSTQEQLSLPVRGTLVASRDSVTAPTGSGITYGIPAGPHQSGTTSAFAMGLWGNAVSTASGSSTVVGTVSAATPFGTRRGTWGAFGGTIANAGQSRVVAFADGISAPSGASAFGRSRLNAYMDTRISDQLMSNVRSNADCSGYRGTGFTFHYNAMHGYQCLKGDLTYNAVTSTPSGVSTQVIKGDVTLSGSLSTGTSGELHLYVDGDVIFGDPAAPGTRTYNRVFIHAPNGTCRAAAGTTVNLTGSLACKTVVLNQGTTNAVTWTRPREQGGAEPYTLHTSDPGGNYRAVDAPKVIHYFERPGFIDQWSQ